LPTPSGPRPAGGAVAADALGFSDLVARARGLVVPGRRALLGVVGSPGAGKSTLVEALLAALRADPPPGEGPDWVAHVPMDGYHLADVELERLGLRDAKGAPDTFDAGGYVALLARLRAADPADAIVYAPAFERTLEQPLAGAIPIPAAARLVLTEGNYLLLDSGRWPAVRPLLDEVWFCTLDGAVRAERLLARHVLFGKPPDAAAAWVASVDEPNAALIEATRDRADLLIPSAVLEAIPPDPGQAGAPTGASAAASSS
jgi:pantothenate kinase